MPQAYGRQLEPLAASMDFLYPEPAADPVEGVFRAVQSGLALMPSIVEVDLRVRGSIDGLFGAHGDLVAQRWAAAASLLASLWRASWEAAGSPPLDGMAPSCLRPPVVDGGAGEPPAAVDAGVPATPGAGPVSITRGSAEARIAGGGGCAQAGGTRSGASGASLLALVVAAFVRARSRASR